MTTHRKSWPDDYLSNSGQYGTVTAEMTGINRADTPEADIVVAGDKPEAKCVKLAKRADAAAALAKPAAKAITVRFAVG